MRSFALVGSVALEATNVFLVTTIMPSVVEDIGGFSYYAMNTTMYVIASIIGAAIAGRMAERIGSRRIYLLALSIFAIAALVSGFAPTMYVLILGRTIEGFAGGILISMAYVLIRQVFEERLWPRAVGLVSAMWGIATFSGPAIGGIFTEYGHWRWALWSMIPLAFLLAIVVMIWLPPEKDRHERALLPRTQEDKLPASRLLLLAASVLAISGASVLDSWAAQAGILAAGIFLLFGLFRLDARAPNRLLPMGSYGATAQRAIYITMSLLALASAVEVFAPYFLQKLQGYSALTAGYLTAVMAAGWSFASLFGSGLPTRWGRRLIQFGPILITVALFSFSWVIRQPEGFHDGVGFVLFILNLLAIGMGIGLAWPHLLSTLLHVIPDEEGAITSSSISTVQQYAMAVGSALAGLIVNLWARDAREDIAALSNAALWLFVLFGLIVMFSIWSAHQALQRTREP